MTETLEPMERVERAVLVLRGERVMLDADLAEFYGVPTKVLNQAVKRNLARFPGDFMFQLTAKEYQVCLIITICDLKGAGWPADSALRLHRAGAYNAEQECAPACSGSNDTEKGYWAARNRIQKTTSVTSAEGRTCGASDNDISRCLSILSGNGPDSEALRRVVEAWPRLPEPTRTAILAMANAPSPKGGGQ